LKGERILLSQGFNVLDHLEYLRLRLIRAILAFLLASVAGFWLAPWLVQLVLLRHVGLDGLVFLSPAEALLARIKLAFALGFVLALPLILYQLWALFVPAMDQKQRRWTLFLIPGVYALFLLGIAFAVGAVLPTALRFLLGFGGEHLEHEISIANYISFVINFALPFGIIFELPVVVVGLTRLGILRPAALERNRKYTIFVIFVLAAILTPPDAVSQIMLAVPIILLFELSLLLARWTKPREERQETEV